MRGVESIAHGLALGHQPDRAGPLGGERGGLLLAGRMEKTIQKAAAALSTLSSDRGAAFGSNTECMDRLEHGYGPFVAYSELVDNGR
jgi:hypothetical protein